VVLLLKQKAQVLSKRVIRLLTYVKIPLSKIMQHRPSKSMIYKIIISPRAQKEIENAIDFYYEKSEDATEIFIKSLKRCLQNTLIQSFFQSTL
jgi:hypothetical protein